MSSPDQSCTTLDTAARQLVEKGEQSGVALRVIGGMGIWQRLTGDDRESFERLRGVPKDIDFLAPKGTGDQIQEVFAASGYVPDERLIAWHGAHRHRYFRLGEDESLLLEIDVFLGEPPTCHDLGAIDPAACAGPPLAATDLLLQKLQIVETSDRDLYDISFVLAAHELTGDDGPTGSDADPPIDTGRIAGLLAADWGFHFTATTNLDKTAAKASELPAGAAGRAVPRLAELRAAIDAEPKTRRWNMRAKLGTRKQWYRDVEEVER